MCSIIVLSLKSPHNFPAATVTSLIEFFSPCSILSLESAYVGIFCFKLNAFVFKYKYMYFTKATKHRLSC